MAVLTEITETLDRQVSTPDRPATEGVRFSSPRFKASTVVIDFTRWVDMGYPNQIVLTITLPDRKPIV